MQPIKDRTDATRRAKKLAKSLRRRREYVENLRRSAVAEHQQDDPIRNAFGSMLEALAERELQIAQEEQNEANVIKTYLQGSSNNYPHLSPEDARRMQERHAAVMERIGGRLSSDRVRHLAEHLKTPGNLAEVEAALGLVRGDKLYMKRVEAAEIAAFGAIRFE